VSALYPRRESPVHTQIRSVVRHLCDHDACNSQPARQGGDEPGPGADFVDEHEAAYPETVMVAPRTDKPRAAEAAPPESPHAQREQDLLVAPARQEVAHAECQRGLATATSGLKQHAGDPELARFVQELWTSSHDLVGATASG
jgi:hypothetical protein